MQTANYLVYQGENAYKSAGGTAGLSVDVILFPIDTIKTRLQSTEGFRRSGAFRRIYSGIGSVAVGSVPGAALFFGTYEFTKNVSKRYVDGRCLPLVHMAAASSGELMACLARVPTEIVKQRSQATLSPSWDVFRKVIKTEGLTGFYRGYWSTVVREIPFSLLQFPLWEYLKNTWSSRIKKPLEPWQSAICGAVAGSISSYLTTPIDVAKTRIMLADKNDSVSRGNVIYAIRSVYHQGGIKGLYAGAIPRTIWIAIGGAIFLGVYDFVLQQLRDKKTTKQA
ncbi:DgyrCDS6089 [Dimorphilus gyrociliatus]|uniref:DgyrCDS6089 n=1 Tax=Dimorphilus gyrociliatus TaxID=2664684 RepID=A0A7I8VM04_9ANNE|nr:DgyrCDS6089 [Dimorphilus gyrociliatus]